MVHLELNLADESISWNLSPRDRAKVSSQDIVNIGDVMKARFKLQVRWDACEGLSDTTHRFLLSYP